MKNYAHKTMDNYEVHYTVESTPTNEFYMEGTVSMNLWGGGQGSYNVYEGSWIQENGELTKKDIWDNMSDDGFGCESYNSCDVQVYQKTNTVTYHIKNGERGKPIKGSSVDIVFEGYINKKDIKGGDAN